MGPTDGRTVLRSNIGYAETLRGIYRGDRAVDKNITFIYSYDIIIDGWLIMGCRRRIRRESFKTTNDVSTECRDARVGSGEGKSIIYTTFLDIIICIYIFILNVCRIL